MDTGERRFFIDRGLGAHQIPSALRSAGWRVTTMRDRYGEQSGQNLADATWIRDATLARELVITKDHMVAHQPAEAQTIYMCNAGVFAFANANLTGEQMIQILLDQEAGIHRWASRVRPPYVVSLRLGQSLRRRSLNYPPR